MEIMKNQLPYYFRMFIALGYIVIGGIVLTTNAGEVLTGNRTFGFVFAFACIVYGIFRAYRNIKKWDKPSHE